MNYELCDSEWKQFPSMWLIVDLVQVLSVMEKEMVLFKDIDFFESGSLKKNEIYFRDKKS